MEYLGDNYEPFFKVIDNWTWEHVDKYLKYFGISESKFFENIDKWANKECIGHLPDTNYWHYCLQLNTYKAILEEKYGKVVEDLYLVCLHPENKNKNYQRIKVVNLQKEVHDLFEMRRKSLNIE